MVHELIQQSDKKAPKFAALSWKFCSTPELQVAKILEYTCFKLTWFEDMSWFWTPKPYQLFITTGWMSLLSIAADPAHISFLPWNRYLACSTQHIHSRNGLEIFIKLDYNFLDLGFSIYRALSIFTQNKLESKLQCHGKIQFQTMFQDSCQCLVKRKSF